MRRKIEAKNQLESLLYSGKQSVTDEKAKAALSAEDVKDRLDRKRFEYN